MKESCQCYRTVLTSNSQDQASHKQHVSEATFLMGDANTSDTRLVFSRLTGVAFGSRAEALELLLQLPGLVW